MNEIKFDVKKHEYKINGVKLRSATEFLSQFFGKFDSKEIARKLAKFPANKKEKRGVRHFLKEWKEAAEHGTRVHDAIERHVTGQDGAIFKEPRDLVKFQNAKLALLDLEHAYFKTKYNYSPETRVANTDDLIAGTIDLLCTSGKDAILVDWKTNKKISNTSYDGKLCKRPISHLADCHLTKYTLQLSLYAHMIEMAGYNIKGLYLVHLEEKKYKIIEIVYEKELIEDLLQWERDKIIKQ